MQTHRLVAHPDHPPLAIHSVKVEISMTDGDDILIEYHVEPAERLLLAPPVSPARVDGLWKTTCFELFLRHEDNERYWEYNFSPSKQWAAYAFDRYREGMRDAELALEPHIEIMKQGAHFQLDADVDLANIPSGPLWANFTAVIEELDGTKSYWAVAHAPDKPDFHHPSCFAVPLTPPQAP